MTAETSFIEFKIPNYRSLVRDPSDDSDFQKPTGWGQRHTLVLLGFLGYVISYAMRINLSFAIVAMVAPNNVSTELEPYNAFSGNKPCPNLVDQSEDGEFHSKYEGEFHWSGEEQGIILGAFSFGYAVSQLPGGVLTDRIGGKWPFGLGILVTSIFAFLTPMGARDGKNTLFKIRVIQGLAEGLLGPAMHGLLAVWLPSLETSKLGAFVYAGTRIGIVLTLPLCGILISSGFMGGWPSVFYVTGLLGVTWFVFWVKCVSNDPGSHPRIDDHERLYIQHSIGNPPSKHQVPTPWRQMVTSLPVTAIVIAQTGQGWGLQTLLTELPTYMKEVLHFNVTSNGWLSALPYLFMWIVSITASWYVDYLREERFVSTTVVRKVCNTIAHWVPAIALVGISFSGCDQFAAVTLLIIALGFNGFAAAGYQMNHIDLAPNHSAVMSGYTNMIANFVGMIAPWLTGVLTQGGGSISDWRIVFWITAAIYILDNLFYICFASGEEQSWNRDPNADSFDYMREMAETFPLLEDTHEDYQNYPTAFAYDNSKFVY